MTSLQDARHQLLSFVGQFSSCAVALSAGVDSSVVAKAAQLALGEKALAVTGDSPSLADGELEQARQLANLIGIRHQVVRTNEMDREQYVRNGADRCYHCKSELYEQLDGLAATLGVHVVFNGANLDDAGDYRPGMTAASEHQVRSPLLECGIDKSMVRQLALDWDLPIWDKPASPCLSSRIAYGEEVTPERLRMIDAAEQFLRAKGMPELRVRYHRGDMARIELPVERLADFCAEPTRQETIDRLRDLGFRFVTVDLQGFRSGSLNALVEISTETP